MHCSNRGLLLAGCITRLVPKVIETYDPLKMRVELELTPKWWRQLTRHLSAHPNYNDARVLHAQCVGIAMRLDGVWSLTTERDRLLVLVNVSRDVPFEQLALKAGECRDAMHQLDTTCLKIEQL